MTGPVPTIRPATHEDLQHLAALLAPEPLFSAYDLSAEALEKRWCDALTRGEGILVACPEAQPVGLCWFSPSGAFALGAYLRLIAVSSSAQSQGLGAHLLAAFEDACAKLTGGWFLLTSDFNTAAQRFYQRHGYREVGQLPDFAKPGITERIFWKPLPMSPT